jgi:DNA-binding MarR family transcriptional regulator
VARGAVLREGRASLRGGARGAGAVEGGAPAFDRLVHEPIRLGILSALSVNPSLSFKDLKALLRTSDGNLSVHARRLEEAALVACAKTFAGRVPRTEFRLTAAGRRALERYLAEMESWIRGLRGR